jgi:hypothetical protein
MTSGFTSCDHRPANLCVAPTALGSYLQFSPPFRVGLSCAAPAALVFVPDREWSFDNGRRQNRVVSHFSNDYSEMLASCLDGSLTCQARYQHIANSRRFIWCGWRVVDQPFGAFAGFGDSRSFRIKDDGSVARSPCLALIVAIDPIERAPRFVRREIYLASCGSYCEPFVFVIHTAILAFQRVPCVA